MKEPFYRIATPEEIEESRRQHKEACAAALEAARKAGAKIHPRVAAIKSKNTCPECAAALIAQWSGVKCSKCDYWFCY